jgi:sulfur carrier protein
MRVTVNGEPRTIDGSPTVSDLVAGLSGAPRGVAVAVNGEVVPRSAWSENTLGDGDRIEILTAVQGG